MWCTSATRGLRSHSGVRNVIPLTTSSTTSASAARPRRTAQAARGKTVLRVPMWCSSSPSAGREIGSAPSYVPATPVTLWPQSSQQATCPKRFAPVPPPCGCVQSRSVSSRMCAIGRLTVSDGLYTGPPMRIRHALALGATALALTPSAALAQGAGDDQYSDPFGSENEQATPTPTRAAPTATPAPPPQPPPAATATASAPQPRPTATPAGGGAPTLPYTGVDGWPVAITGTVLLGAGLALRARLREPD